MAGPLRQAPNDPSVHSKCLMAWEIRYTHTMVLSQPIGATIGVSTNAEAEQAGCEAAESALSQLAPRSPKFAVAFGSSWFEQSALLAGIHSALGEVPLVGESTAGEIIPSGPTSHSCVVVLLDADSLTCGVGLGEDVDQQPREAGQRAAYMAVQEFHGAQRSGFLLFGDGLITNYAEVVRGLQEVLGTNSLIVGGMAGDDLRFGQTYQYHQDRVVSRAVVGALLGGSIKMGVGIEHGFTPISKPRRVTRARANVIMELDTQPAASVYEEYFGPDLVKRMRQEGLTRQGIAYPLGVQSELADHWLLRNVVSFGDDGSLLCTGEVLQDSWLQLMIGSRELAMEAAQKAARQAVRSLNRVAIVLIFDSVVRRKFLGPHHAALEIARIREAIGTATPLAGCYTYGEQAPLSAVGTYENTATQTGSVLAVAIGS